MNNVQPVLVLAVAAAWEVHVYFVMGLVKFGYQIHLNRELLLEGTEDLAGEQAAPLYGMEYLKIILPWF